MLFKRLLANLIDTTIFWSIYFAAFFAAGLETDEGNSGFLLFVAFLVTIILPVLSVSNTFGKIILKMTWAGEEEVRPKLLIKYLIYFLLTSPSLKISSALTELIPHVSVKSGHTIISQGLVAAAFICADVIVYLLSWGKYHIADYLLGLSISGKAYRRTGWKLLGMTYLFTAVFVGSSAFMVKRNFVAEKVENHFKNVFYNEQYPPDLFFGGKVMVSRDYNDHVFAPGEPASFLFENKYEQKTLFVMLPYEVFQSEENRRKICIDLLEQSWTNDMFSFYKSAQVKIVLSSYKLGSFFNYYNYYRIYYFDPGMAGWGIYGGIKTDSTMVNKYVSFINRYHREKAGLVEQKFHMPIRTILEKMKTDTALRAAFLKEANMTFKFSYNSSWMNVQLDHASLRFTKIDFKNTPLHGNEQLNFPVSDQLYQFSYFNIFADQISDVDDNIFYLLQLRKITNGEF